MQNEELDLRDRTKAFALRVVRMYSTLPKTTEAQVLGKQLLRSGTSIGANYREAYRARSKPEFIANAAILCAKSKRLRIGWNCWSRRRSFLLTNFGLYRTNAMNSPLSSSLS